MGVLVALVVGLVIWIVGWTFGFGGFDTFMLTLAILLAAFTARLFVPFVKAQLGRE